MKSCSSARWIKRAIGPIDKIQLVQIKQMFKSFDASTHRFVPTKELLAMYPDSIEAREESSGSEGL